MLAATRTLLVDDHPVFRAGLRIVVERVAGIDVIGEAATCSHALEIAGRETLELAIIDVVIPEMGGAALTRELHLRQPGCKILALSMTDEPLRIADMFRAGASGYAIKSQPTEEIAHAIEMVLGGMRYMAPQIAVDLVEQLISPAPLPLEQLTRRERGVFELLVRGRSNSMVAEILAIAPSTVEAHRRHIMQKFEARSIVDLVLVAQRHGLIGSS